MANLHDRISCEKKKSSIKLLHGIQQVLRIDQIVGH